MKAMEKKYGGAVVALVAKMIKEGEGSRTIGLTVGLTTRQVDAIAKRLEAAVVYVIQDGKKKHQFKANGKRRVELDDGMVLVQADVILADGTKMDAILELDEQSCGEHWNTYFLHNGRIVEQGERGFYDKLGKTSEQVYPYRYKYRAELNCHDHHVGDDGWSR